MTAGGRKRVSAADWRAKAQERRANQGPAVSEERTRLMAALIDLNAEVGFAAVSVPMLAERAGVAADSFHANFTDLEDCLLQTFNDGASRYNDTVFAAYEAGNGWRDSLRGAAYASALFIRENNRFIMLAAVAMGTAGDLTQARRDEILKMQVDMIDAGRGELDDPDSVDRGVAESVIGSIFTIMSRELGKSADADPVAFVPELMYVAVRPYLGHEIAKQELEIPPPA